VRSRSRLLVRRGIEPPNRVLDLGEGGGQELDPESDKITLLNPACRGRIQASVNLAKKTNLCRLQLGTDLLAGAAALSRRWTA